MLSISFRDFRKQDYPNAVGVAVSSLILDETSVLRAKNDVQKACLIANMDYKEPMG